MIGSSRAASFQVRVAALYASRDLPFSCGARSRPLAQEVTQDVFEDPFVALEKGARAESEQGWLYAVAGRAAVDY